MTLMLLEISPLAVVHEFILATFIKNEFEYVKMIPIPTNEISSKSMGRYFRYSEAPQRCKLRHSPSLSSEENHHR